jgi:gamma-glutamyltranspeptidase/glutathione hydrolase
MQTFTVRKAEVHSRHGLVAAQNYHAATAGAAVLARGGNAMDAAIVTALTLSVVEPWLSGVGGGGFLLHSDGATGEVATLDFNVVAAQDLDPFDYPLSGGDSGNWFAWPAVKDERNATGYHSIAVPGAVAGFAAALERFGTISFAEALAPAIEHAERGLEIDWFAALSLAADAAALAQFPASAELLLDQGRAPRPGDPGRPIYKPMPRKASLLRRLAHAGARDFYEGEIARMLVADLEAGGSRIRLADLAVYNPVWSQPLHGTYRSFEISAIPGLSGGPSFVQACAQLETSGLTGATSPADAALIYADVIREAYRVRLTRMGHAANPQVGCTTHLSVVDASGNMVSLTNTLLSRFGSKIVLPQAGILMNNGIMWFDPRPGQPNFMAPGTKPLANMCPLIVRRAGGPSLAMGAAGGRTIFPTLLQILSYVVDYGMTLEDAFHMPRIDASTPTIRVNTRAENSVVARIGSRYPVEIVEDTLYPTNFAVPSAVLRWPNGTNTGMAHHTSPWAGVAIGQGGA